MSSLNSNRKLVLKLISVRANNGHHPDMTNFVNTWKLFHFHSGKFNTNQTLQTKLNIWLSYTWGTFKYWLWPNSKYVFTNLMILRRLIFKKFIPVNVDSKSCPYKSFLFWINVDITNKLFALPPELICIY